MARIVVNDNGAGITPETGKRLFVPFNSTKGLRGTGLGLVVTKKIIEEHGGRVDVTSTSDQGTSFTVVVPVKNAAPDASAAGPVISENPAVETATPEQV